MMPVLLLFSFLSLIDVHIEEYIQELNIWNGEKKADTTYIRPEPNNPHKNLPLSCRTAVQCISVAWGQSLLLNTRTNTKPNTHTTLVMCALGEICRHCYKYQNTYISDRLDGKGVRQPQGTIRKQMLLADEFLPSYSTSLTTVNTPTL